MMSAPSRLEPRIRAAMPADARDIARINVDAWRAAYGGIVPGAYLDSLAVPPRAERWEKALRENAVHALAGELARRVAGYVTFGAGRDPGEEREAEIHALYVDPLLQRRGLGRALLAEAERRAAILQAEALHALIWVLERNHAARNFYAAQGYVPDGTGKTTAIGGAPLPVLRYRKLLLRREV